MPDSNITKQTLANCLKELMSEKDFGKIRVDDIAGRCGMTRQAFYYHFKDKYDLMNWICYTETAGIITSFSAPERWTDGLKELCLYMQKNKTFYINALNTTGQNSMRDYLSEYISTVAASAIENLLDTKYDKEQWDFIVSFFSTAIVAFIIRWANEGMNDDPDGYINKIRGLFDGSVLNELQTLSGEDKPSAP